MWPYSALSISSLNRSKVNTKVCDRRNNALETILNLLTLYFNFKLKNNIYYKARIKRRLSLLVLIVLSVICLDIDIVVK